MGSGAADAPVTSGWTLPSLCLSLPVCGMGRPDTGHQEDEVLPPLKSPDFLLQSEGLQDRHGDRGAAEKGRFPGNTQEPGGAAGREMGLAGAARESGPPWGLSPSEGLRPVAVTLFINYCVSNCTESSERQSSLQTIYQREEDRGPGGRQAAPRPHEPQPLVPALPGLPSQQCLVRA